MPLKTLIILRVYTHEKANSSPLKNDGWKAIFSFWVANFQVRAVNIVNFPGAAQFSTPTTSPFMECSLSRVGPSVTYFLDSWKVAFSPSPPKKTFLGFKNVMTSTK